MSTYHCSDMYLLSHGSRSSSSSLLRLVRFLSFLASLNFQLREDKAFAVFFKKLCTMSRFPLKFCSSEVVAMDSQRCKMLANFWLWSTSTSGRLAALDIYKYPHFLYQHSADSTSDSPGCLAMQVPNCLHFLLTVHFYTVTTVPRI